MATLLRAPAWTVSRQPVGSRWWVLAVLGLVQLMVVLDATITNIALPSAQRDLGFDDGYRQWIVTAYPLSFGSMLLLGGRLSDLFGHRRTFIVGLTGFAVVSAVGGAATGFGMLVTARAVQGLFGALFAPAALSLLTTTFTAPKDRARAFGLYGAISGAGAAVGPILGGLLTEFLSWRFTLYVNDIIAVVVLAGAIVFVRPSLPARPRLDMPGVALVSTGLFSLVYGFANAATISWLDWPVWGFLAAGTLLLLTFFRWQARATHALLPIRVLADRDRGAAFLTVLVSAACTFGLLLFLTYYLQGTLGFSPIGNGVALLPMVAMLMVTAQLGTNVLVPRYGAKLVVPAGLLCGAVSMAWLTRLGLRSTYFADVFPPLLMLGACLGLAIPTAMSRATLGVRLSDQGVASAVVNTSQQVGGSISIALLNTVATGAAARYARDHPADPLVHARAALHSYATVFLWAAGFFALGAIVTALLFRRKAST